MKIALTNFLAAGFGGIVIVSAQWRPPIDSQGIECGGTSIKTGDGGAYTCFQDGEAICRDNYPGSFGSWMFALKGGKVQLLDPNNAVSWEFCAGDVSHVCIGEDHADRFADPNDPKFGQQRPYMFFFNEKTQEKVGELLCDGADGLDGENLDKPSLLKMVDNSMLGGYVNYGSDGIPVVKFKKGQTDDPEDLNSLWQIAVDDTGVGTQTYNERKCTWTQICSETPDPVPKKRVLVSGYGAWYASEFNPAGEAALFLNGTCLEPTEEYPFEVCFEGQTMSVDEDGTQVVANQIRDSFEERQDGTVEWDAVILLGLDGGTKGLKLELVARNLFSIGQTIDTPIGEIDYNPLPNIDSTVDIRGCRAINDTNKYLCDRSYDQEEDILTYGYSGGYSYSTLIPCNKTNTPFFDAVPGGACREPTTAPLDQIHPVKYLPKAYSDLPVPPDLWSTDAGSYFCNEVFYRTQHTIRSNMVRPRTPPSGYLRYLPSIFVHVAATNSSDTWCNYGFYMVNSTTRERIGQRRVTCGVDIPVNESAAFIAGLAQQMILQ